MSSGNGVPSSFCQGDSVVFSYSDPAYPSSAWDLKLALLKNGLPAALPAAASNADGSFTFALAPGDTAALSPGRYVARLVATATNGGARMSLCQVGLFVFPDLTLPLAQTDAMKALDALKAGYAALIGGTIQTFSGGGQSWSKKNLAELRSQMDRLQVIVENELTELGLSTKGGAQTIVARFC